MLIDRFDRIKQNNRAINHNFGDLNVFLLYQFTVAHDGLEPSYNRVKQLMSSVAIELFWRTFEFDREVFR